MKEHHIPEVVTSRQKSNLVDSDLVPGGYGGCSLARPHGQRTPPCYLAQHCEGVVKESDAAVGGGRAREGGRAGKRPSLEAGGSGSQRLLRPSSCHPALAGSSQE